MGYYIEVPKMKGKAQQLVDLYGARILPGGPPSYLNLEADEAVICVVDNGPWEAAGYAYDERELDSFAAPDSIGSQRPRTWLIMDKAKAKKLSGYTGG